MHAKFLLTRTVFRRSLPISGSGFAHSINFDDLDYRNRNNSEHVSCILLGLSKRPLRDDICASNLVVTRRRMYVLVHSGSSKYFIIVLQADSQKFVFQSIGSNRFKQSLQSRKFPFLDRRAIVSVNTVRLLGKLKVTFPKCFRR